MIGTYKISCKINGNYMSNYNTRKQHYIDASRMLACIFSMYIVSQDVFVILYWLNILVSFCLVSLFNDISTFVDYLMPKPFLLNSDII